VETKRRYLHHPLGELTMQGQAMHLIASVFFVLGLMVLGLVIMVYTYVDEILTMVRELSKVKRRVVTREENETARRIISAKGKDKA
jgi:hypothetical protein